MNKKVLSIIDSIAPMKWDYHVVENDFKRKIRFIKKDE